MTRSAMWVLLLLGLAMGGSGCQHPSVTAVALDSEACGPECGSLWGALHNHCLKTKEEGIPFYLPKPLLIVSKNFRNIEEAKVGLTDGAPIPGYFDDQSKYADLNSRSAFSANEGTGDTSTATTSAGTPTTVTPTDASKASSRQPFSTVPPNVTPNELPLDGLLPETFYTYQIVFVPDMTRKYGLKVKGGVGEIRAALNLVNGWQFTGLGPYYMKDSSTAQNTLAAGITANLAARGIGDVIKDIASLNPGAVTSTSTPATGKGRPFNSDTVTAAIESLQGLNPHRITLAKYAEITIYEAYISPEGTMEWKPIHQQAYDREVLGVLRTSSTSPATTLKTGARTGPVAPTADRGPSSSAPSPSSLSGGLPVLPSMPGQIGGSPVKYDLGLLRSGAELPILDQPPASSLPGSGGIKAPTIPVQPANSTQSRSDIKQDPIASSLLAKRLGLLGAGAPTTGTPAANPATAPITINQYATPAAKAEPAPAKTDHQWFHKHKQRSKIQTRSTQASGVGMPPAS